MNECDIPQIIHGPTGKLNAFFANNNTILVVAECKCGGDCMVTASLMAENFFTPNGEQGVR